MAKSSLKMTSSLSIKKLMTDCFLKLSLLNDLLLEVVKTLCNKEVVKKIIF